VAIYEYRCEEHGVFDESLPLGTAPGSAACPTCGGQARRIISAPMVRRGNRSTWSAAIERAEKSRHEPEVVTSVPSAGARRRPRVLPLTPTLARLPRP
jgi:putative FmdB family regulatory protein